MTDLEISTIIQDILNKATEDESLSFNTIFYWDEFIYYQRMALSTKLVIRLLKNSANKIFKGYCRDVIAGISNITKLLAYQQLLEIIAFYENELKTIQSMLDDYDKYLGNFGNFVRALLGERRDLW